MQSGIRKRPSKNSQNSGFTLVELLVAIGIIAVLAGLLLTGVQSARSAVKKAEVAQELRNLETALTQFHAEFGMYPPSSITLHGTSANWNLDVRSKSIIQKLWPNYDFTQALPSGTASITLNGAECLVFFLGGIYDSSSGTLIGFSRNPRQPFSPTGANRIGPFHEFVFARLGDRLDGSGAAGTNGVFEYYDAFPDQLNPIWYISSYDGQGYRPTQSGELPLNNPSDLASRMKDCYRQGFSLDDTLSIPPTETLPQAWGLKSYQLISPGPDKVYGVGSYFADGMPTPKQPSWITDWGQTWSNFSMLRNHNEWSSDHIGGDGDNVTSISNTMR